MRWPSVFPQHTRDHDDPAQPEIGADATLFDHPISKAVYINDATIIFDNVFIPNERIFLKGEWEFAGQVAYMFANFHRLSAETYKAMELSSSPGGRPHGRI